MRRITATFAALAVAGVVALGVAAPAHADQFSGDCTAGGQVCFDVNWHNVAGPEGITINYLILRCDSSAWQFGWDHPAVDGKFIHIHTNPYADNTLRRSWSDADSNVDTPGGCVRTIPVGAHYPGADSVRVEWNFIQQRNLATDIQDELDVRVVS